MCKLREKLIVFDLLVEKLVKWQSELLKAKGEDPSNDECLQKFDSVRFMKLLYFVCLESCQESLEDNLFGLFDNFLAYERGPVEVDVYSNRSILPRYTYENSCLREKVELFDLGGDLSGEKKRVLKDVLITYPGLRDTDNPQNHDPGAFVSMQTIIDTLIDSEKDRAYSDMIIRAVERLNRNSSFCFEDKDELIEVSHQLKLWSLANMTNNRLDTHNTQLLQEEFDLYRKRFPTTN